MKPNWLRHRLSGDELAAKVEELLAEGFRLGLVAAHDDGDRLRVVYLFLAGHPDRRVELESLVPAEDPVLPSLAYLSLSGGPLRAGNGRPVRDSAGWASPPTPAGAPCALARRLASDAHRRRAAHRSSQPTGRFPFVTVEGTGVYEIPVGPVHAGLIEPGHFRFSVVGETVLRLKARLWFVHRGLEKLFEGRPATGAADLAERVSGDTSAAHALAHSLAVEDALGIELPDEAQRLRALLVELERLYNHAADLGALANDVGFGIANAHAQRIREQLLRVNAAVTGHRLLRGAIYPGGVTLHRLPAPEQLQSIATDLAEVAELTLGNSVVYDRFAGTSVLDCDDARAMGCLGYVARASGMRTDARTRASQHRSARHRDRRIGGRRPGPLHAFRRDEFAASAALAGYLVESHSGATRYASTIPPTRAAGSGVGIVEGWRGTIVHRVEIDGDARITRAKIVDPSWFNWPALPVAMSDTIVPDFPLTNKSFNLSYAGNDL